MSPLQERKQLLQRLRDFFEGRSPDPELDEYELVDAFDFSGDSNEHTLQEQISEYATSRFPDFHPLLIRRALMLLDKGDREMAKAVASKVNPEMLLAKLYNVVADMDNGAEDSELLDRLDKILAEHPKMDDEDMIRFTEVAMELQGGYEWLKERMPELRKRNTYLPTLLFEMAQNAKESGLPDDAISYIDELTMIEPFEIEYWEMLAELYVSKDDLEKAESAVEYAMAIDPKSPRSRLIDAHVKIARKDADPVSTIASVEDIVMSDELDTLPLAFAVSSLVAASKPEIALDYLNRYLADHPLSVPAIDLLVGNFPDSGEVESVLERFWQETTDHTEFFWSSWGRHHFDQGNYAGAVALFKAYMRHSGLTSAVVYLQALYMSNKPAEVVGYVVENGVPEDWRSSDQSAQTSLPDGTEREMARLMSVIVFVMSLIRTNNDSAAIQVIDSEVARAPIYMAPSRLPLNMGVFGYRAMLSSIKENLLAGVYPDDYDPMLMPQNILLKT